MAEWVRGHNETDLPPVRQTPQAAWKWLFDEWSIQLELATARMRVPDGSFRQRLRSELADARSRYAERGSHLSYPFEREVTRYVDRAAVETFGSQPFVPQH